MASSEKMQAKKYASIAEVAAAESKSYSEYAQKSEDFSMQAGSSAAEALESAASALLAAQNAANSQTTATEFAKIASQAADQAIEYGDNKFTFSDKYVGLSSTQSGQYFRVPQGTDSKQSFIYYLNNNGEALAVADSLGYAAYGQLSNKIDSKTEGFLNTISASTPSGKGIIGAFVDGDGKSTMYATDDGAAYMGGLRTGTDEVAFDSRLSVVIGDGTVGTNGWLNLYDDGYTESNFFKEWPDPPEPLNYLNAISPYTDESGGSFDPTSLAIRAITLGGFNKFNDSLASFTDLYLFENDYGSGKSAAAWMLKWARYKALYGSGFVGSQSNFERHWRCVNIFISYQKAKGCIPLGWRDYIKSWVNSVSLAIMASMSVYPKQNHTYWASNALLCGWNVSGTKELYDRASQEFDNALAAITDKGLLPLELARGKKALHYHSFALAPLVMMAEIAALNNEDWYSRSDGRIHLLAESTIHGLNDPAWFKTYADLSTNQDLTELGHGSGWTAFYARRFPKLVNGRLPVASLPNLSTSDTWMGGNCKLLADVWIKDEDVQS